MTRRVTLLALALLLLVGCTHHTAVPASTTIPVSGLPRPTITPGVILTTRTQDVCTPGWAGRHRHGLTVKQKTVVLHAYGYPASIKVAEYDHLISLELGGGNGPKNIFPMIDQADARRKDALEHRLHDDVCDGRMTLTEAQARIKMYWQYW